MRTRFRAITALALVLVASLIPAAAYASTYQTSQVDMRAHVASDGSLQVSEERTFEFTDDVNGVYWEIPLGQNQQGENVTLSINGVSVDGDEFQEADYASSGDYGVYTVDTSGSSVTLKIFMPSSDGSSADVEISYTMSGAVMLWQDTAELYWKFVGDGWGEDSNDVTLNVSFDASLVQQNPATVGDTLRAWGHGPLTATVTPDDEDGEVDYDVPCVRSGEFAEARIAFPASWVPSMPLSSRSDEERLPDILDDEEKWAEEANARRERARLLSYGLAVLTVVVSVALLAVTMIQKLRLKRPVPTFNETYFRDVPSDDHPAVLATFMNKGTVPDRAFAATLMKLTDDRLIKLQSVATPGQKAASDYCISMDNGDFTRAKNGIDRAVLELYFLGVERQGTTLSRTFQSFKQYARKHTSTYSRRLDNYTHSVTGAMESRNLVASDGTAAVVLTIIGGTFVIGGGLLQMFFLDAPVPNIIAFGVSVVCSVITILLGLTFRRLTQEGTDLENKCRALKRWLEDFTRLGEAVPGDLILWNKLMVMGVALGVSKKTLRELADAVPPAVRNAEGFYDYYPVYWWCYSDPALDAPTDSIGRVYHNSVSAVAASESSSGGGGGGGFSGGGGGGCGGGGGGTF